MSDTGETLDLAALLDGADRICERVPFGAGEAAFEVDIRRVDTRLLQEIGRRSTETVTVRGKEQVKANVETFRKLLLEHCLAGWEGLTVGKVLAACNRRAPAGNGVGQAVPFTPTNALLLLEKARGVVGGDTIGFDDFVFTQATRIGQAQDAAEAAAKNG